MKDFFGGMGNIIKKGLIVWLVGAIMMSGIVAVAFFGGVQSADVWNVVIVIFAILYAGVIFLLLRLFNKKGKYKGKVELKNISSKFEELYKNLYSEHISELEKVRKKSKNITIVLCVFWIIGLIVSIFIKSENIRDVLMLISGVFMVIVCILAAKNNAKYTKIYKNKVVANFIKLIDENLEYNEESKERDVQSNYKTVNFDDRIFNEFTSEDNIQGKIANDVFVEMDEINVNQITGVGKNRHVEKLFEGLFVRLEGKNSVSTRIKISRDNFKIFESKKRLQMDSSEFENIFDVYSEDKILAARILTADVMQLLVEFYNSYKVDFDIVLIDNKIYMRFATGNMFEPSLLKNSMDKQILFTYYSITKFVFEVSEKINKILEDIEI